MAKMIQSHTELESYRKAFEAAMKLYEHSKRFPKEETYSLTDQVRRSSRSVCSNLAEAWRRRRYRAAFINKLTNAKARRRRPRPGSSLRSAAGIWKGTSARCCTKNTRKSCGSWWRCRAIRTLGSYQNRDFSPHSLLLTPQ